VKLPRFVLDDLPIRLIGGVKPLFLSVALAMLLCFRLHLNCLLCALIIPNRLTSPTFPEGGECQSTGCENCEGVPPRNGRWRIVDRRHLHMNGDAVKGELPMPTGAHVLACLIGLAIPSGTFANESVYQKFSTTKEALAARCKELDPISAADRKQFAMADVQGHFYCTGYKTYKVLRKTGSQTSVQFGYLSDHMLSEYFESFVSENAVGDKIEWRLDDKGVLRAAIARFNLIYYPDADGKTQLGPNILAS
jgi:hypothetical protein